MAAKSNRKGGKFENDVAKTLSVWITEGKRNDILDAEYHVRRPSHDAR